MLLFSLQEMDLQCWPFKCPWPHLTPKDYDTLIRLNDGTYCNCASRVLIDRQCKVGGLDFIYTLYFNLYNHFKLYFQLEQYLTQMIECYQFSCHHNKQVGFVYTFWFSLLFTSSILEQSLQSVKRISASFQHHFKICLL